jgi:hypothetical protein
MKTRRQVIAPAAVSFAAKDRQKLYELLRIDQRAAEAFIEEAQRAARTFLESWGAEIPRPGLAAKRRAITVIGTQAEFIADNLRGLDLDARDWLDMAYCQEAGLPEPLKARDATLIELQRLARVCKRAGAYKALNPPEGPPVEVDKRALARACAAAYRTATGKAPSASANGTFARALLIVMKAARVVPQSQAKISQDFLEPLLNPDPDR